MDDLRLGPADCSYEEVQPFLDTVIEAVAFCVYDARKVEEIVAAIRARLALKYAMGIEINVTWQEPRVRCTLRGLNA